MLKTDAGENIFLPSYLRQKSRNNSSNQRPGHTRNVQPKKTLGSELKRSEKRWMQPSEVAKEGSEEEHETDRSSGAKQDLKMLIHIRSFHSA